jgi:hypothetical protein
VLPLQATRALENSLPNAARQSAGSDESAEWARSKGVQV